MGPTPGCYGCRCIARGDRDHNPHNSECRERVIEWLKRQEDPNIQARLASAQLRTESQSKSQDSGDAKVKDDKPDHLKDEWTVEGIKIIRHHRTPRNSLYYPTQGGCPVDWSKLKPVRQTHAIVHDEMGTVSEHTDEWNSGDQAWAAGSPFGGKWTGWTQFE